MQQKSIVGTYVIRGIIIGLVFPIAAALICWLVLSPPEASHSLGALHKQFPLLWIIDSAPLVLGVISWMVGTQVNKSHEVFRAKIESINKRLLTKNMQLEDLIGEKEVLLKEIHHRVKNNLQVITSLLSLQASFIDDEKAKGLFRYSQYRINSMAVVHEMLYQTQDISKVDYGEYTQSLISGLISSMKGSENKVELEIDIPDIHLNIDTAIPLGLLINEIVTNSLKYGIPGDAAGKIYIQIRKNAYLEYRMLIGDDGVGFSDEVNFRNSNSLGLILVHRLSLQLKGTIEKDNSKKGTHYILTFQEIHQTS